MTTDDRALADLTLEIVSTHHSLQGLPPAVAELQYIVEAQKLDGYGVEYYPAKVNNITFCNFIDHIIILVALSSLHECIFKVL